MGATTLALKNLKQIMRANKIKNVDLARGVGKCKNQITNYFRGHCVPPWEDMLKIVNFLQVAIGQKIDFNSLFGNSEKDNLINTINDLIIKLIKAEQKNTNLLMALTFLQDRAKKSQHVGKNTTKNKKE